MLAFFTRKPRSHLDAALKLINKGDKYAVTPENIKLLYLAVEETLAGEIPDVGIREQNIELYRNLKDFVSTIERANESLMSTFSVDENFNLKQSLDNFRLDEWLVDHENRRTDYYAFLKTLLNLVVDHLIAMEQSRGQIGKNQYRGMLSSLYSVHCDMLSLAELHLRYLSQR